MTQRTSLVPARTFLAGAGGGIVAGAVAAMIEIVGVHLQEGGTRPTIDTSPAGFLRRRIVRHLTLSALYGIVFSALGTSVRRQQE